MKFKSKEGEKLHKAGQQKSATCPGSKSEFHATVRKAMKCCDAQARITHLPMLGQEGDTRRSQVEII